MNVIVSLRDVFSDWAGHECREQDVLKVGHREYRGSICSEQRDNQSMKKYEVLPHRSTWFVITVILRVKTGPPEASTSHYVNRNNLGGYFGPSLRADSRRRGGRRGSRGGRGGPGGVQGVPIVAAAAGADQGADPRAGGAAAGPALPAPSGCRRRNSPASYSQRLPGWCRGTEARQEQRMLTSFRGWPCLEQEVGLDYQ